MSDKSDLEDTENESSTNAEDLEVQLYSLVHYATDPSDDVATQDASTVTKEVDKQQDLRKDNQVNCALSVQSAINTSSNPQQPTEQNDQQCSEVRKTWRKRNKQQENVVDYLALLQEYKAAKAQHNFAEISRNRSLLWYHKQQSMPGGYRKRYWMKETSEYTNNPSVNYTPDSSFPRSEEISHESALSAVPQYVETHTTQHQAIQDAYVVENDATRLRNSLDPEVNHIYPNADSYEPPPKKKKKKKNRKPKKRKRITDIEAPGPGNRKEQYICVQDSYLDVLLDNTEIRDCDDIESRYNIAPSKKEVDDVIVLESSDSESSIVVLEKPPTPEPPPVVCLDSDSENVRHHQELVLNIAAPKQPLRENVLENLESKVDDLANESSSTSKAVASTSTGRLSFREERLWKWSDNMARFYNESWGGERFDVPSLQRQMSNNPANWHVSQRDFIHEPSYNRYKGKCFNCSRFGHPKWHCPEPPRMICCKMCGAQGHTEPRCPFPICLQCGERTQVYLRSCNNCRRITFCTVCSRNDHSHDNCPEVWRKYCSTTSVQQIRKVPGPRYKPREQQWCCVCAKKGHFPEDCCQPFFIEPITFQFGDEFPIPVPKPKIKKRKNKFFTEFRRRKVHSQFGIPC